MARPKKLDKKNITSKERQEWQAALDGAYSGKLPWLHHLIESAGYIGRFDSMTAREISRMFSVTPQAVGLWHSNSGCPRKKSGVYDLHEVLYWRIKYLINKAVERQIAQAGGDPLLMGDGSPALEKYRVIKTEEVEYKLNILKGKYYAGGEVDAHWRELGDQIGNVIHKIQKKSPKTAELLKDAISAFNFTEYTKPE